MGEFIRALGVNDLPPGSGCVAEVNGRSIAIFNVEGAFLALDNTCAHKGGPLGEGELDGEVVTCPWHRWEYNVRTGISLTTPSASVKVHEVKVDGEDVEVLLSD